MSKNEIHIKRMKGSSAAAGDGATAITASQTSSADINKAINEMRTLIALIRLHQQEVPEAKQIELSVIKARKELKRKKPDLDLVRGVLSWVAGAVSGVGALADAVTKIQALIGHL